MVARVLILQFVLSLSTALASAGCERSDGHSAQSVPSGPGVAPTAAPTLAPSPMATASSEATAALETNVKTWEGRPSWRVTFTATPEPAGFPTGAFRAATKMCLDEVHASTEATLDLTLTTLRGHVTVVTAGDAGAPAALVSCLQRLYGKISVPAAPPRFAATVRAELASE